MVGFHLKTLLVDDDDDDDDFFPILLQATAIR